MRGTERLAFLIDNFYNVAGLRLASVDDIGPETPQMAVVQSFGGLAVYANRV
jgi:hypothetical protein